MENKTKIETTPSNNQQPLQLEIIRKIKTINGSTKITTPIITRKQQKDN